MCVAEGFRRLRRMGHHEARVLVMVLPPRPGFIIAQNAVDERLAGGGGRGRLPDAAARAL